MNNSIYLILQHWNIRAFLYDDEKEACVVDQFDDCTQEKTFINTHTSPILDLIAPIGLINRQVPGSGTGSWGKALNFITQRILDSATRILKLAGAVIDAHFFTSSLSKDFERVKKQYSFSFCTWILPYLQGKTYIFTFTYKLMLLPYNAQCHQIIVCCSVSTIGWCFCSKTNITSILVQKRVEGVLVTISKFLSWWLLTEFFWEFQALIAMWECCWNAHLTEMRLKHSAALSYRA